MDYNHHYTHSTPHRKRSEAADCFFLFFFLMRLDHLRLCFIDVCRACIKLLNVGWQIRKIHTKRTDGFSGCVAVALERERESARRVSESNKYCRRH